VGCGSLRRRGYMKKKYSDWLRIDLHIHTDKSRETKSGDYKGNFDVTTLKSKLIENEVEIFSLTDHNIINVTAYEGYYDSFTDDEPLLLVGVELDIEGSTGKGYHSLLIFNYSDIENMKIISQKLENKYHEKSITNPFERKLTFDNIIELFKEDEFFFIPHAKKGGHQNIVDAELSNIQDTQRMILLMQSALEKVTEQEMKEAYQKGFDLLQNDNFKDKKDIAYINFSDNHYIEQYPCRHMGSKGNHEFDYIKGNKSYETIRLAFIDPQSRIKTQSEYNTLNKTFNTIDNLKIDLHQYFTQNELVFSPHLNVVIGGRSSGKSLLMNLIGGKIDSLTIDKDYYDKFHGEHISIKAKNDSDYKQQIAINKPVYINQGDIVNYFEKNELKSLAEKSNKIIEYHEAKKVFENHKKLLQSIIQEMIDKYKDIQEFEVKKFELHKKTIESIYSSSYTFNLHIRDLKTQNENTVLELYEAKQLTDALTENITSLSSNKHFEIDETEKTIIEAFENLITGKLKLIQTKQKNKNRIDNFISEVEKTIEDANSTLSEESQQKNIAKNSVDTLQKNITEHFLKYTKLKVATKVVETFEYSKKEKIDIDENISLILEVEKKDDLKLKETILDAIKDSTTSKGIYINLMKLLNNELQIKTHGSNQSDNLLKKIKSTVSDLYNLIENPKDYLDYQDEDTSKSKSPGFNSEKYLGILLKNSRNKIIFIDQPEDNLGNKFISEELVATIRDIKFKNQIFLVTHNPSIVVYGDAENIIIAENLENKISYKQIVLEDVLSQKEICSILDGGEYIFNNRAKKYNIQRILKENSSKGE
jgi:predicted metal-dependent phosphoesterase TrpH